MTSNAKTFSTALRCTELTLELQPPQDPAAPVMRGVKVTVLECTDDKCLPGHDPRVAFQHDLPVQITQGPSGQPCVLATIDGIGSIVVPVVDGSLLDLRCSGKTCLEQGCQGLCHKLSAAHVAAKLPKATKFYVYRVTEAHAELPLQGKLIAIPVLPGQPGN